MYKLNDKHFLLKAFFLYVMILFFFVLSVFFLFAILLLIVDKNFKIDDSNLYWISVIYLFITYFCCGVYLQRKVLRRLISWHPIWNTVEIVFREKLEKLILWPVAYPKLFLKIVIYKS